MKACKTYLKRSQTTQLILKVSWINPKRKFVGLILKLLFTLTTQPILKVYLIILHFVLLSLSLIINESL